ncbi:MAG: pilus assembly protein N-terminal domain-containing protein [Hyphococcus sp.]
MRLAIMRAVFSAIAVIVSLISGAHAKQLWLTMDQVRPVKLEQPAQSIVVGNPAIADVEVQDSQNILLFGRGPGLTNIYLFDEQGEAIDNLVIRVRTSNADMLTFHRGSMSRTTLNCTPNCEPSVTVGDDQQSFMNVSQQVQNKMQQAIQAANGNNN